MDKIEESCVARARVPVSNIFAECRSLTSRVGNLADSRSQDDVYAAFHSKGLGKPKTLRLKPGSRWIEGRRETNDKEAWLPDKSFSQQAAKGGREEETRRMAEL